MNRYFLLILALCAPFALLAQTDIVKPNLQISSKVAPDYFGPNAFPIPDMLDGTTSSKFRVEIAADYFAGDRGDKTEDIFFKVVVPLFSDRVNLSLWLNSAIEWYQMSPESHSHSRLGDDIALKGKEFGDAYISTDIHLLKQTQKRPDISLRVALKTALGYGFFKARYYDGPGYFFDTSVAKSINFNDSFFKELRFIASAGFLCWQTDNGRQNDAPMYGVAAKLATKLFTISESFGGYIGWENDGDRPMSLKTDLRFHLGRFEPLFYSQVGFNDYPYTQWRVGTAYIF